MLKADEEYFAKHGEPLFSSHMLDLSEEKDNENIGTCVKYFTRMAKVLKLKYQCVWCLGELIKSVRTFRHC